MLSVLTIHDCVHRQKLDELIPLNYPLKHIRCPEKLHSWSSTGAETSSSYIICRTAEWMTSHFARHKTTASEVEEFTTSRLIYAEKHLAIIELRLEFLKNGLHSPSIALCATAIDHFQSHERKSVWVFRHLLWWWIWPVFNPLRNRFISKAFIPGDDLTLGATEAAQIVKLTFIKSAPTLHDKRPQQNCMFKFIKTLWRPATTEQSAETRTSPLHRLTTLISPISYNGNGGGGKKLAISIFTCVRSG